MKNKIFSTVTMSNLSNPIDFPAQKAGRFSAYTNEQPRSCLCLF